MLVGTDSASMMHLASGGRGVSAKGSGKRCGGIAEAVVKSLGNHRKTMSISQGNR